MQPKIFSRKSKSITYNVLIIFVLHCILFHKKQNQWVNWSDTQIENYDTRLDTQISLIFFLHFLKKAAGSMLYRASLYGITCVMVLYTVLPPNYNHPKCRQNAIFVLNGLYSEVFLIHEKKHTFQNPWLLLGGWLLFRGVLLGGSTLYQYKIYSVWMVRHQYFNNLIVFSELCIQLCVSWRVTTWWPVSWRWCISMPGTENA